MPMKRTHNNLVLAAIGLAVLAAAGLSPPHTDLEARELRPQAVRR